MEDIRKDISDLITGTALLKNVVDTNHKAIIHSLDRLMTISEKHEKTLYGNGTVGLTAKVGEAMGVKKLLEDHTTVDKWMFGILITMEIGIFVKLFLT